MSTLKISKMITAHSWNADRSKIAVSENSSVVTIYGNTLELDTSKWEKQHILEAHSMVVCGIDWHPTTNKIVTCSHDVNAFVWSYDTIANTWRPSLSILRINHAALQVKWSPDGSKFAVATGSKVVPVCYYDSWKKWWISNSRSRKTHHSTILDVAWHPNSQIIATGSCDFKCRVFSAFMSKRETPTSPQWCQLEDMAFGTLLTEFVSSNGWVQAVAWSPSGNQLGKFFARYGYCRKHVRSRIVYCVAFCGNDSSLHLVHFTNERPFCQSLKLKVLPYEAVLFLNEDVLVAAGYGFTPDVFQRERRLWKTLGSADTMTEELGQEEQGQHDRVAQRLGELIHREATGTATRASEDIRSKHRNVITDLRIYGTTNHLEADSFSSSGKDGRIVVWKSAHLRAVLANIKI